MQISVKGMHCSACSSAVESALAALPGVQHASVALLTNSAEVRAALLCPRAFRGQGTAGGGCDAPV